MHWPHRENSHKLHTLSRLHSQLACQLGTAKGMQAPLPPETLHMHLNHHDGIVFITHLQAAL